MGIVIGAVAVVFVLALIIFPGVRGKLKVLVGGFLNIFVEDIAKTPEGAKAVFQQAIEKVQERYNSGHQHNKGVVNMDVVNVEIANLDDLKKRFVEICATINRPGMEDLMAWLERSDFYTAPASTRFHGNYTGGLLEHSLNVYDKLSGFVARYPELEISPETVAVTALFHDLTKVNYYTVSSRNVKDDVTGAWHKEPFYKTEDRLPLGHGEKSVIILQSFIKLTRDEIVAIRWHMGSFDCAVKGGDYGMGNAFETYPLAVMTHLADMEATYLVEGLAAK